ncbi:unnamed protein product [Bursaphelenchus xylophilus]|uniref:(pine wood nematode) hypothetical protein n=1 Tax=Bursaphelenchus xylophilus TaxID=6326 RepID=A0A1I7RH94_BURXY|nr:unnamed protein product [Bursaphelenchus xylophilus]CAG9115918.1 unnamed protein product [Bursaphelenchus xylophilus]
MRIRTKSDEPCSSKSLETLSPVSPRIAKRNANLLNGFDLKNGGSYANNQLGTIPECVIKQTYECLPALKTALESKLEDKWPEITYDLQFQLERMLAENIDYQKTVNGEVMFLTTGDYPTDDLTNRPMPSYDLRRSQSAEKPRGRKQKSVPFDEQPSCSKFECDEEDAGSDVVTSCGEMEEEQPYLVLDIPHRFWTWAREYLGHIDDKFVTQFNKEFYQRYHPAFMSDLLINEPFKYNGNGVKAAKSNGVSNGTPKRLSVCNGNGAPKLSGIENGVSKANGNGNPAVFGLMKNLVSAYTDEFKPSPKKGKLESPLSKKRKFDFLNGYNGYSNGIENEKKEPVNENELMEMAAALTDCLGPISMMPEYESEESRDSFAVSSTSKEALSTENVVESIEKKDLDEFTFLKINEDGKDGDQKWDEVSLELLNVQSKLDKLLRKTTPILERCKHGLESELAHSISTRELNKADEKLFSIVDDLSVGRATFEDCVKAWNDRQKSFVKHYCNSVVPVDQDDQYESDWSEEFAMDSSPPRLSKH